MLYPGRVRQPTRYDQGVTDLETLSNGPLAWFRDWPNPAVRSDIITAELVNRFTADGGVAIVSRRGRKSSAMLRRRPHDAFEG